MKTAPNILLVDDDVSLCEMLKEYLSDEKFTVEYVSSGKQALDKLSGLNSYDALVLDIMMPGMSGLDVLQRIRGENDIPVIMLTGRGDDIDRIVGLEMGADDYMSKPCNPAELVARLKAVLRRTRPSARSGYEVLSLHGIHLDVGALEVKIEGKLVSLTSAEFRLLYLLMQSPGETLSKSYLTLQVLSRELESYDRSIDVHVSRVRKKLMAHGKMEGLIRSVRGTGYQMITDGHEGV